MRWITVKLEMTQRELKAYGKIHKQCVGSLPAGFDDKDDSPLPFGLSSRPIKTSSEHALCSAVKFSERRNHLAEFWKTAVEAIMRFVGGKGLLPPEEQL